MVQPSQARSVFTPEAVASINRAYTAALAIIDAEGKHELSSSLAEHMMSLARSGEADETRLAASAVVAVLGSAPDQKAPDQGRSIAETMKGYVAVIVA